MNCAAAASRELTILIASGVPAYRRGLAVSLADAGFDVREVDSPELAGNLRWDACLFRLNRKSNLAELAQLREQHMKSPLIALINGVTVDNHRLALRMGVEGVVPFDANPVEIVDVLTMALRGITALPVHIARTLAEPAAGPPIELQLTADEEAWLRALSDGSSVTSIARNAGYSERQMYRLIQRTYRKIGAKNRAQAIALAIHSGLVR